MIELGVRLSSPLDLPSYGQVVRGLLEVVVMTNRDFLTQNPRTPALYDSGIVYGGGNGFLFDDIPTIQRTGRGICSGLAAWRVAELRQRGVNAGLRLVWSPEGPAQSYHVQVRLPNGSIEDPSEALGMTPWPYR